MTAIVSSRVHAVGLLRLIVLLLACYPLATIAQAEGAPAKRPNIIWFLLEDWGPELSCYGTKGIYTPNCDKVAAQGIRYTRAFTTAPVCSSSRSAMYTGFHQNYINAHQHRTPNRNKPSAALPYGIKPIGQLLKEAGYYTCLMRSKKTDANFSNKLGFMGRDWKDRKQGQPFFAQITLQRTHRPWYRDPSRPVDPNVVEIPPYYVDTPLIRRDWANGYESAQNEDRVIGNFLERLENEGLTDNTLIFIIGDNGRCHMRGKQFLYEGGISIPMLVRWPGVIEPGQVRDELVMSIDITATILKAAGIKPPHPLHGKDLLGAEIKERKYVFAARDKMDDTHDAMRAIRSKKYKLIHNLMPERPYMQFNRYKESSYPGIAEMMVLYLQEDLPPVQAAFLAPTKPEFELYDLEADPYEINNLADDPKHAQVKNELLTELKKWRQSIKDQGVSDEFRKGGWPATYPTRTLERWREIRKLWEPWVFRGPEEKVSRPTQKIRKMGMP